MDSFSLLVAFAACAVVHVLTRKPKHVAQHPVIPSIPFIASFMRGEAFDVTYHKLVKPALEKTGFANIWMRGGWDVMISDLDQAREVIEDCQGFAKAPDEPMFELMLASSLFGTKSIALCDGAQWRRHRKPANPTFKKLWDPTIFGGFAKQLMKKLRESPADTHALFQHLAVDCFGTALFGHDFGALQTGGFQHLTLFNELTSQVNHPLYLMFPQLENLIPARRLLHRKKDQFRSFFNSILQDRKVKVRAGFESDDLLTSLTKSVTSGESDLTDSEILNDMVTFFLAGHDTTATNLSTSIFYLAKHQAVQDKARREAQSSEDSIPTHQQLRDMPFINCIIKESMRINTPSTLIRRFSTRDTTLSSGVTIPQGAGVIVNNYAIHKDPRIFKDPESYNPFRFQEDDAQVRNFMGFGSGTRMCIGFNYTLTLQRIVLAMILKNFRFELAPGSQATLKVDGSGFNHPKDMHIVFKPLA